MPLPLLFIGAAAATGGLGIGKTVKAGVDAASAKKINRSANEIVEMSTEQLNAQRMACGNSLRRLGEEDLRPRSQYQRFFEYFFKDQECGFQRFRGPG